MALFPVDRFVIITAYNRKEYLLNAIKSVINQTLDKKYYEIIVIKNFNDNIIDDFINKNNIKNIFSNEKTLSGKLSEALKIADSNIISFLDDDYSFLNNKLETVYNKFKDINVVYYHNDNITVDKNKNILNFRKINGIDYNLSSISVKKSVIKIDKLIEINNSVDTFIYLCALESNKKILNGKEKLTYYMFHNSYFNHITKDFNEFKKYRILQSEMEIKGFTAFKEMFTSKKAISYLKSRITDIKIDKYIYSSNEKPDNLINYIINNTFDIKHKAKLLLSYVFIIIYPDFKNYFYKKVWNNYTEKFKN